MCIFGYKKKLYLINNKQLYFNDIFIIISKDDNNFISCKNNILDYIDVEINLNTIKTYINDNFNKLNLDDDDFIFNICVNLDDFELNKKYNIIINNNSYFINDKNEIEYYNIPMFNKDCKIKFIFKPINNYIKFDTFIINTTDYECILKNFKVNKLKLQNNKIILKNVKYKNLDHNQLSIQ